MKNILILIMISCFGTVFVFSQKSSIQLEQKDMIKKKNKVALQQQKTTVAFNEADMFQMYYPNKKKEIQAKKKILLKRIKKGDKKSERDLKELKVEESKLNNRYKQALKFSKLNEKIYFKIGPMPPCPKPNECGNEWLRDLETVIVPSSVKNISITAHNEQGQTVGILSNKESIYNKNIGFKTFPFNWKLKPKGPITFKIKQVFAKKLRESYEVSIK